MTPYAGRTFIVALMLALAGLIIWLISFALGTVQTLKEINEPNPETVPLQYAANMLKLMKVPGKVRKIVYYNADSQDMIGLLDGDGDVDETAFAKAMEKAGYTATPPPGKAIDFCWTRPWKKDAYFVLLSHRRDWIVGIITRPAPRDPTQGQLARVLEKWPKGR